MDLTTEKVITMEYVPGIKINDIEKIEAAGIDRQDLARKSAESYLTQICRHGFFHCDPHPGNVACDAEEGGRLIYYDFGMMDELKDTTKKGLVDLIFGVYENDPKGVCDSLEQIEVLNPNSDRVSVEKIARYFLNEFSSASAPEGKYVNQLSKEEQKAIRRKRRAQLGADLFSVGSDVPFKFPPTFTFVFRAFTSLDGIGKGLDEKYDLTKLAQPYLKELIDLRDGNALNSFLLSFGKKVGWRPQDLYETVSTARNVARMDKTITRMEEGDLKVRVRVLESERAFKRLDLVQKNMANAMAASTMLQVGLLLVATSPVGASLSTTARACLTVAGIFGIQVPIGMLKLKGLDKKIAELKG
jgi:predicted unusual protein kinase regulating ubiquinone biosynthesis (AarF/ABC1/UbiB family)